jgi:hypothetical protein
MEPGRSNVASMKHFTECRAPPKRRAPAEPRSSKEMRTNRAAVMTAIIMMSFATAALAQTPAQYGARCAAAWSGPKSGGAFGAYQAKCVTAATRATNKATDAGNVTNAAANRVRATAACAAQFPPPRRTAARKKAYAACVTAVVRSQVAFAGRPLKATLSGSNEVPAAGAATGTALVRLNQGQKRVCFTLAVSGLNGPATAAHIHTGAAGATGAPVVELSPLTGLASGAGTAKGCVNNVDAKLIKAIRQKPGDYYVNVHTAEFPNGAARGQLALPTGPGLSPPIRPPIVQPY